MLFFGSENLLHRVQQLDVRVGDVTLNYRLCFCMMSIGPLTARGDPHTLALLTLILRSMEWQSPPLVGTLISLRTPHPPLLCRAATLPLSLPLSLRPLSSLLNLARVLVCPALRGFPGVLIPSVWSGRATAGGSRTQQPRNPFPSALGSLLLIWINT